MALTIKQKQGEKKILIFICCFVAIFNKNTFFPSKIFPSFLMENFLVFKQKHFNKSNA
jgi:hypothetical protein